MGKEAQACPRQAYLLGPGSRVPTAAGCKMFSSVCRLQSRVHGRLEFCGCIPVACVGTHVAGACTTSNRCVCIPVACVGTHVAVLCRPVAVPCTHVAVACTTSNRCVSIPVACVCTHVAVPCTHVA